MKEDRYNLQVTCNSSNNKLFYLVSFDVMGLNPLFFKHLKNFKKFHARMFLKSSPTSYNENITASHLFNCCVVRVVQKRRKRSKNSRISHLPRRYYAFSAMNNNRAQLSPHYAFSLSLVLHRRDIRTVQRTIAWKKKTDKACTLRDIRGHLIAAPQKNRIFQRLAS